MSITAALSSLNAALSIAKAMRRVEKDYDAVVWKSQIVDLTEAVAEAKTSLLEAQETINAKDREIEALKEKLAAKAELTEVDGHSYAVGADGKPTGSPFCDNCLAQDGTQVRPTNLLRNHWQCPRCKALYAGLRKFPG